ncbi:hypothetical protein HCJ66_11330 [Listeria sp. FSL L7-1582]|uniref:hypothetical protein n=1 Tax=Listeria portnoyi TaxID=2713504 RepID=UPI00164D5BF4|nr:hypothetical protein [Listeria portnoyi]MBC6310129.1 hypothetical protein [Listeria portnoyi]
MIENEMQCAETFKDLTIEISDVGIAIEDAINIIELSYLIADDIPVDKTQSEVQQVISALRVLCDSLRPRVGQMSGIEEKVMLIQKTFKAQQPFCNMPVHPSAQGDDPNG